MTRIDGDDGLLADEVGDWAKEKHSYLTRYISITRATRGKYIGPRKGGAGYFDLFCATGRSKVRNTGEWIDGSAVAAWKESVDSGAPFTQMFISDIDQQSLDACTTRLKALGAPVIPILGNAVDAVQEMQSKAGPYGLHLGFVDPYNLETLDFRVIEGLTRLRRIDLIIHLSAMDLRRNLGANLGDDDSAFDLFAPGWRDSVDVAASHHNIRAQVVDYWRQKVAGLGKWPSTDNRLIKGAQGQHLYWLMLAAGHDLAHKFWSVAANPEGQLGLF